MTRRTVVGMGMATAATSLLPGTASGTRLRVAPMDWKAADGRTGKEIAWNDLPGKLAGANAVFLGEQHDDPETHRAEAALLEAVHKKAGDRLTLAMEMFERDQQAALSDYLTGKMDEAAMAKAIRLWPNYPTDYRPLIEYAKANRIPVVGSNAPQRLVRMVGKDGLKALSNLPTEDKPLIAAYVNAPEGDVYATRFAAVMAEGHGNSQPMDAATIRRIYEAQCLRDDTMAESIVRLLDAGRTVLHVNGSFHSDAGLGTAARVLWRRPLLAKIAVIKIAAVKGTPDLKSLKGEGDYLVFVPDTRPEEKKA